MINQGLLERIVLIIIALIVLSQLTVIVLSAISNHFRRRRQNVLFPRMAHHAFTIGKNKVRIFTYGNDLYQHMLQDIEEAKTRICLESFIWKGDTIGQTFKDALIKKAQEGVEVYVIFDAFANLVVRPSFKKFPSSIHSCRYRAWRNVLDIFDPRRLARDHRKLLVIDDHIGYTGGYNIGDLYGEVWRDTHVRVEGSAANNLYQTFTTIWNDNVKNGPQLTPNSTVLEPYIRLYTNNPSRLTFPIRSMYIDAIDLAKEQILLTTPYFVPDRYVLSALIRAAKRGVKVQLIVPEQSNHLLADWLARTYFTDCLRQNIRILLYQGAMIHAKTATIDHTWTTIGSANLDRLSLIGNHEINLEFFDHKMAKQMEMIFLQDSQYCKEVDYTRWLHRPLTQKLGELVLSPFWPFL
nr:phosphatidylserine/phosphatidylglycerophosphate/cardiolipin synthase family protein [Bacilli bacterium]